MTYEDIVRGQTSDVRDQIQLLSRKKSDLEGARLALIDQVNRLRTELTQERKAESRAKHDLRDMEKTEDEILRRLQRIDEVRRRLNARLMDQRAAKDSQQSAVLGRRGLVEEALARIRAKEGEQEALAAQIEAAEKGLVEKRAALQSTLRVCMRMYLESVWKDIAQAQMSARDRTQQQIAVAAFERARHEDPSIADLYEQREQYRQLMKQATVPAVRGMLNAEYEKISKALNAKFPGALDAQVTGERPVTLLILHQYVNGQGQACVFMPFGPDVWKRIAEGGAGPEEDRAMRLMHAFVKGKDLRSEDGYFVSIDQFCAYESTVSGEEMALLQDDFVLELQADARIVFRMSPLAMDSQEAINGDAAS